MKDDDFSVLGEPHVHFDGIAVGNGGAEGGDAVFGRGVVVQAAVRNGFL